MSRLQRVVQDIKIYIKCLDYNVLFKILKYISNV